MINTGAVFMPAPRPTPKPSDVGVLLGGKLLRPAQLHQMRRIVAVDEQTNKFWPGSRYGLGLMSWPLPCGGHGGDQLGYRTETASRTMEGEAWWSPCPSSSNTSTARSARRPLAPDLVENALCHRETPGTSPRRP